MRSNVWKLATALCFIMVLTGWGEIRAGEMANEEQAAARPPAPAGGPMMMELTPEQTDKILAEIKEKDPKKGEELMQLKEKDPNAFKMELRKSMRERFMERMRGQRGEQGKRQQDGPEGMKGAMPGSGQQWGHGGPEMMRDWMKERHEEYMKWLRENYPDEATKLEQLKNENPEHPEQFMRAVMVSGRRYWPIFQASKDNPPLAALLKEQLALKEKRMDLVKQINTATDEKQKKELTSRLETIVGQQFDLIVKRKQLALDDMTKKLTELQKEVEKKKTEVEKWNGRDFKNQQVKQRVNELLSEKEKFEWE